MSSDNITLFFDNVTLLDGNFTIPEENATIFKSTAIPYLFKGVHSEMARWSFFIAFFTWIPTILLIFRSIYKVYKSNKRIKNSISTQLCMTVLNIVLSNLLVYMTDMALIRIPQSGFENAWFIEYENHPFVLATYHLYLACSTYSRTLVVMLSVFRVVMAYYPKDYMYTNNWIGSSFVIIYPMILYFTYQTPVFEFHSQLAQYFSSNRTDATLELNWAGFPKFFLRYYSLFQKIMIIPNFLISMVLLSCCVFLLAVYLFKLRDTFFVPKGSRSRERSLRNELAWTFTTVACFYLFLEDILVEIFSHLSQELFGDLISILPFTHNIGNLSIAVIFWATHPIFGRNGLISTYRMETRNQ